MGNTHKLDSQDFSSMNDVLEKKIMCYYEVKTVSLTSISKKGFCIDTRKMIARHLTHVKLAVGKNVKNATIEEILNNNLRHIHAMYQFLTRDEMTHIVKEHQ